MADGEFLYPIRLPYLARRLLLTDGSLLLSASVEISNASAPLGMSRSMSGAPNPMLLLVAWYRSKSLIAINAPTVGLAMYCPILLAAGLVVRATELAKK